jgi:N-acetylneuraminate synthase
VVFRRSLYYVKPLKAGEVVTPDAIRSVRPGYGAAPKHWDRIVGRRLRRDIEAETPVSLDDLA